MISHLLVIMVAVLAAAGHFAFATPSPGEHEREKWEKDRRTRREENEARESEEEKRARGGGEQEEEQTKEERKQDLSEAPRELEWHYIIFSLILVLILASVGAFLAMVYGNRPEFAEKTPIVQTTLASRTVPGEVIFSPPAPAQAPMHIRPFVQLGYNIMMDTRQYAPKYVTEKNGLSCRNCHFEGGRIRETISLVGVAAVYPQFRSRYSYPIDLAIKTRDCFERSLNAKAPPPDSPEMQALLAYYQWISKGVPVGEEVPWLGLAPLQSDHTPDGQAGMKPFTSTCTQCHGPEGQGTAMAPPLWGDRSFNDGASMYDLKTLSSFIYHFMPLGRPNLKDSEAIDAAAFIQSRPRPHYKAGTR